MHPGDAVAIVAGIAAIAGVNWYFFVAPRRVGAGALSAAAAPGAVRETSVTVRGGYDPQTVRVSLGGPVRIVFDRQEAASCSEEVVFPDFGVRKFLPPFQKTAVELTPTRAGAFEFTCGMGMLRGRLVVENAR